MFSQIKEIKHIKLDFCSVNWVMPQGVLGGPRGAQGVKNLFLLNMVMWHIKLMEMLSRTE